MPGVYTLLTGTSPELILALLICLFACFDTVLSLCGPGYPGTYSVDKPGLEFTEVHLSLLPDCWE